MARTLAAIEKDIAETQQALDTVQGTETEVYARIVGYYRSLKNWNKGKKDEFAHRTPFVCDEAAVAPAASETPTTAPGDVSYKLFARKTCPNCPPVKEYLAGSGLDGLVVDVDTQEGLKEAMGMNVFSAPTVILYRGNATVATAHSVHDLESFFGKAA
jgi:ribonucleoside-triphosphate reductase